MNEYILFAACIGTIILVLVALKVRKTFILLMSIMAMLTMIAACLYYKEPSHISVDPDESILLSVRDKWKDKNDYER